MTLKEQNSCRALLANLWQFHFEQEKRQGRLYVAARTCWNIFLLFDL
jgi:hypothetical protein